MLRLPRSSPDQTPAVVEPREEEADGGSVVAVVVGAVLVGSVVYAVTRQRFPWFAGFAALPFIPP